MKTIRLIYSCFATLSCGFCMTFLLGCAGNKQKTSDEQSTDSIEAVVENEVKETGDTKCESFSGYVVTKDMATFAAKDDKTPSDLVISKGKVCVSMDNSETAFCFEYPDVSETIKIDGDWVLYYRPAQDDVDPMYIPISSFRESTERVVVSTAAPSSIKTGVSYTYKPICQEECICEITVKPIKVADPYAVLKSYEYSNETNDFIVSKTESLTDAIVYELDITSSDSPISDKSYFWNNMVLMSDEPLDSEKLMNLIINDDGYCFMSCEGEPLVSITALSPESSHYIPSYTLLGWISGKELVLNDKLYILVE